MQAVKGVASVDERPAVLAVTDEGELATADGGEPPGLALGLERSVEPRRPDDHRRQVAALEAAVHELLRLELRLPVPEVRVVRRVLGEPIVWRLVGAER